MMPLAHGDWWCLACNHPGSCCPTEIHCILCGVDMVDLDVMRPKRKWCSACGGTGHLPATEEDEARFNQALAAAIKAAKRSRKERRR